MKAEDQCMVQFVEEKMVQTKEKIKRNERSERNRHADNEEETKQKL